MIDIAIWNIYQHLQHITRNRYDDDNDCDDDDDVADDDDNHDLVVPVLFNII